MNFASIGPICSNLHSDPYSSKFPPLTREPLEQLRPAVAQQRCGGAAGGRKNELGRRGVGDSRLSGKRRRQNLLHLAQKHEFAAPEIKKADQRGFTGKYLTQRAHV